MAHRPMAESIARFFVEFYRTNGFDIEVPYPKDSRGNHMSDIHIQIGTSANRLLFYRPPTSLATFPDMMDAFTSSGSWTAHHMEIFESTVWEPAQTGYWFWADIGWDKAMVKIESDLQPEDIKRLLSLEEYIIFFFSLQNSHPQIQMYPRSLGIYSWLRSKSHHHHLLAKNGTQIEIELRQMAYLRYCEPVI
ncbi:MAG: hypothetical protein GWN59_06875 [Calditrichae bacterium]|nr:hypothetical protein [Calditrichia bacterium]NIV72812.1 hypothetical protein [Calditrichia bacterium]